MEQFNSFLAVLKTIYSQQGRTSKILLPGLFLFAFCCLCSILIFLFPARSSPKSTAGPRVYPTQATQPTPTALFNYGFTPFPTLIAHSALPTAPSLATATSATIIPTETATPSPTITMLPSTIASSASVLILRVDKPAEYVEIQNAGNGPVNLSGWKLISETGNQPCPLNGILQPGEILRVWSRKGNPGLSCGYAFNIWNDTQVDPAVLYDPQGKETSRYP